MKLSALFLGLAVAIIMAMHIVNPIPAWAKSPVNKNWRGLAIEGYDPVAYFTMGKPVEGKKEFEFKWQDAKWRFGNKNHLNLFKSDPKKFAPQYGGY